jgi:hypothetical protein
MVVRRHRLATAVDYALELLLSGQAFAAAEVLRVAQRDEQRVEHGLVPTAPTIPHLRGHAECRLHEVRMGARPLGARRNLKLIEGTPGLLPGHRMRYP